MRILILGDIHSNWPALTAVARDAGPVDAVLCTGDVVDYGADPAECVEWLRRHATAAVRGNHDHAVAQRVPPKGGSGLKGLAAATRPQHWDALPPRDLRLLGRLPVTAQLALGGRSFFLVHGTPHDPLDEYAPPEAAFWRDRLARVSADFVCVGHTHLPYLLPLGAGDGRTRPTTVINPGSVGQPRDGDPPRRLRRGHGRRGRPAPRGLRRGGGGRPAGPVRRARSAARRRPRTPAHRRGLSGGVQPRRRGPFG